MVCEKGEDITIEFDILHNFGGEVARVIYSAGKKLIIIKFEFMTFKFTSVFVKGTESCLNIIPARLEASWRAFTTIN